jgi:hypothetical protein
MMEYEEAQELVQQPSYIDKRLNDGDYMLRLSSVIRAFFYSYPLCTHFEMNFLLFFLSFVLSTQSHQSLLAPTRNA